MLRLLIVFAILMSGTLNVSAQNNSQLLKLIEPNVTNNLPDFALTHRIIDERTGLLIWEHGKEFVSLWIEFHQTTDRARGAFVSAPWVAQSEGMGEVNIPDERVSGLGYDNYWSEDVASKKRGLHFYRGHIAVIVTAPSNEIAERVARQIDLLLPDA